MTPQQESFLWALIHQLDAAVTAQGAELAELRRQLSSSRPAPTAAQLNAALLDGTLGLEQSGVATVLEREQRSADGRTVVLRRPVQRGQLVTSAAPSAESPVAPSGLVVGGWARVVDRCHDSDPPIGAICRLLEAEPSDEDPGFRVEYMGNRPWMYATELEPAPAPADEVQTPAPAPQTAPTLRAGMRVRIARPTPGVDGWEADWDEDIVKDGHARWISYIMDYLDGTEAVLIADDRNRPGWFRVRNVRYTGHWYVDASWLTPVDP